MKAHVELVMPETREHVICIGTGHALAVSGMDDRNESHSFSQHTMMTCDHPPRCFAYARQYRAWLVGQALLLWTMARRGLPLSGVVVTWGARKVRRATGLVRSFKSTLNSR